MPCLGDDEVVRRRRRDACDVEQIMYARSTTIQAQSSSIDAGIRRMRDGVMPALEGIDACVGLSLLVDRTSGRCIATSSWESEEAMRAGSVHPADREQAAELGGGAQVEEWEVAAMHREGEGPVRAPPGSRSIRIKSTEASSSTRRLSCPPSRSSRGIAVPACSSTERPVVAAATFDNAEAIERNSDQLDRIRATGSHGANAEVLDQCDFQLAVERLRVPEMA